VAWRERILAAALKEFGKRGYDAATVRQIAQAAGVDSKLVHYYFGAKEELFVAAIAEPFRARGLPEILIEAAGGDARGRADLDGGDSACARYLKAALTALEDESFGPAFIGLVRGLGAHEASRRIFLRFITDNFIEALAPRLPGPAPEARAALVGSHLLGLVMARYVLRVGPLAALSIDQLAQTVGPVVDHYLLGDLPPA
jgi:AcrR family transcriptional regulator